MKKGEKNITARIIYIIVFMIIAIILIGGYIVYSRVFTPNIKAGKSIDLYIYIPTGSVFADVKGIIAGQQLLIDNESFDWTARQMNYDKKIKAGRYQVAERMNNHDLISLLRSGKQTPVKVTFNNIRTIEQLAGRVSKLLEADSVSIVEIFRNEDLLAKNGFNIYNGISIVIPNTYEFYWNSSATKFYERMYREYHSFWNAERTDKAILIGLTKEQVSVIASIVQQETQQNTEKSIIAGVYINRFMKNWKLEADPTLVFALGDFTIRRVLNEYKLIDSPYNTYLNYGLPPGPICIPSISSIDAVLDYAKHDFMFFCAKEDFSGFHAFAKTYDQHLANARKFQRALNKRGILE